VSFKLFELFGTVDANTKPFDNALAGSQRSLTGFASFAQRVSAGVSRSFERMARSISASRAFDQLGRSVGAVANGLRASVGGGTALFGALSLAAGTAGVFLTLRKAVMGASDLNETLQKTGVVFGGATGIVTKGADEMARRFGVVKNEYLDAASSLGLIGKSAGLSEAKSAKLADQLARLAIDASSFYNVPLEEALISMRAGLVGESEPLRRFGVLLNEAAVQNEALRLGLATTKKEISEGAKVQARSSLIIKGLADATGDLERTEGSFANRLRKISGQITNMLTAVGQNILPIFQSLADVAQRALTDINSFLEDNSAAVRAWSERVAAGIAFAGRIWKNFAEFKELGFLLVHQKILQGIEAIKGAFWTLAEIARPIWDNLVATAKDGLTIIMNAFKGLQRYLETLFESIGQALTAALVNAVADSVNNPMIAALGDTTMFRAMFAPLQAVAQTAKIQAPPVRGDTSGFSPDAIMKGTVKTPALIETMADAMNSVFSVILKDLPQINREIDGVVKRIEKAWAVDLLAEMFGDTPKRFREGFQNLIKRTMTPVERLNADNLRRGLKRANFTDTSKEGQARAEGILKRRAAEEAEARKKGRLGGPTFDGTKLGLKLNTPGGAGPGRPAGRRQRPGRGAGEAGTRPARRAVGEVPAGRDREPATEAAGAGHPAGGDQGDQHRERAGDRRRHRQGRGQSRGRHHRRHRGQVRARRGRRRGRHRGHRRDRGRPLRHRRRRPGQGGQGRQGHPGRRPGAGPGRTRGQPAGRCRVQVGIHGAGRILEEVLGRRPEPRQEGPPVERPGGHLQGDRRGPGRGRFGRRIAEGDQAGRDGAGFRGLMRGYFLIAFRCSSAFRAVRVSGKYLRMNS
jgi:hypothetical protein